MSYVYFENNYISDIGDVRSISGIIAKISQYYNVPIEDLYATVNGKIVDSNLDLVKSSNVVRVHTRLVGGKGGFGSMLRAIGAQIEKTTNREACRDLSGRRLRDINEEKRLRKWLEGQEDREREAAERKQKKIEKILAEPRIEVKLNPQYEKERQELPERVSASVDAGWNAAGCSHNTGTKRKAADETVLQKKQKKKAKLWIDAELSDCSSLSDDDEEIERKPSQQSVSTDSGNESDKGSMNCKV